MKLNREFISSYLKAAIPEYEEMLVFSEQNGGWINMPPEMIELIDHLKLHNYPELYRSEETLAKMLLFEIVPQSGTFFTTGNKQGKRLSA